MEDGCGRRGALVQRALSGAYGNCSDDAKTRGALSISLALREAARR